jgi:hypothetical protein
MHLQPTDLQQKSPKYTKEKNRFFSKCCCENWISTCRRLKLEPCLTPCTNIHSKWIKDLDTTPGSSGDTLGQTGIGNEFLNRTPKAQHLRERMNKWDCLKLNSFCIAKETVTRQKRQPTEWRKYQLLIREGTNIQNLQGPQKTQPLMNQHPNEEMGT